MGYNGYIYPLQTYQVNYAWAGKTWDNNKVFTMGNASTDSILISNSINTDGEVGTSNLLVRGYLLARIDKSYTYNNPYTFVVNSNWKCIWVALKDYSSHLNSIVSTNQSDFQQYYYIDDSQEGRTYKIYYNSNRFVLDNDVGYGSVTQSQCPITYSWNINQYLTSESSPASSNIFINSTQSYGIAKEIKSAIYN